MTLLARPWAALALLAALAAPAAAAPDEFTTRHALEDLDVLIATARSAWAYAEDKRRHFGVDLDALRADAAARLETTTSWPEAVAVLREVVASLKDGHAYLRWSDPTLRRGWGFTTRPLIDTADGVVLDGARVLTWDDRPIEEALAEAARRVPASTEGMRRRVALEELQQGTWGDHVYVRLARPGAEAEEKALFFEARDRGRHPAVESRALEQGVGYVRIRTFFPGDPGWGEGEAGPPGPSGHGELALARARQRITSAFAEHAGARALVLDLRGNGGGTDLLGTHVAHHLLPGRFVYYGLRTRWSPELARLDPAWAERARRTLQPDGFSAGIIEARLPPPDVRPFLGPVWVLLDSGCFSTTDNLLACLRDEGGERFRFVGRPSGGGTGAPREVAVLPRSGAGLTLTTMLVTSPKGEVIEGRGTRPTTEVRWTLADVVADRDPDLEAALAQARDALKPTTRPAGARRRRR